MDHPQRPHQGDRHTVGDVARGLGAVVVLIALAVGVPFTLWAISGSPLPGHWPGIDDVVRAALAPDDGSLFLDALIFVGWLGWATFAVSVVVEIPAVLRGVVPPRLPGMGTQQRLVAGLVAAVAAMFPTQIATAGSASPALAESGRHDGREPAPPVTNELLDELAVGSARNQTVSPTGASTTHAVVAGDTLWDIAGDTLGDPYRYEEIYVASVHIDQRDGRRLNDPDVILPGWELTIPATARDGHQRGPSVGSSSPTPATPKTSADTSAGLPRTGTHSGADLCDEPLDAPSGSHSTTDVLAAPDDGGAPDDVGSAEDHVGLWMGATGVGAVLASGLVTVLGARRSRRQRQRRAGERPVAEPSDGRTSEIQLRHTADPASILFVDRVMRSLSAKLGRPAQRESTDQGLPPLRAARLASSGLELCFAEPADLPAPFVHAAQRVVWRVQVGAQGLLNEQEAADVPAPYPGLVTVGHDRWGGLLLADLEYCRALHVTGSPELVDAALTAFAAELATSAWADDMRVSLVGFSERVDLDVLETGRVRQVDDFELLFHELEVRMAEDRALLSQAGVSCVRHARGIQMAESTWTPEILIVGDVLSDPQRERLADLIDTGPSMALAAIVGLPKAPVPAGADRSSQWSLALEGSLWEATAVLDPLGVNVRPQLLDHDEYRLFLEQLRSCSDVRQDGRSRPEPDLRDLLAWAGEPSRPGLSVADGGTAAERDDAEPVASPAVPADSWALADAPRLRMLGPVEVSGTAELGEPNKLGQLTELAMFIALTPGCDGRAIDEALWPGAMVTKTTRSTAISKLRRWLGTDAQGTPWLPRTEGRYTFRDDVRSDWQRWCELLPSGPVNAPTERLEAALGLVRGRPFAGRGRRKYAWVDYHVQEMITAIVDACHELAVRSLADGRPREALRVSLLGLSIEPGVELLWRDRLKAEMMLGDRTIVLASIETLRGSSDELGSDLDDETEGLIEQILRTKPLT